MFRRAFERALGRVQVGSIPPALPRANQWMASRKFVEAANIFKQFADSALARSMCGTRQI
jgi:hypothetical protein